jgi:hypothetical protein
MKEYGDPDRLVTLQVDDEEAHLEVPSYEGTVWYGFTFGEPTVRVRFPAASLRHLVPDGVLEAIAKVMNDPEVSVEWLRHIIQRDGVCECLYDKGCCGESPFYCKEWSAHLAAVYAEERAKKAVEIAEQARHHFAQQQEGWEHLLP